MCFLFNFLSKIFFAPHCCSAIAGLLRTRAPCVPFASVNLATTVSYEQRGRESASQFSVASLVHISTDNLDVTRELLDGAKLRIHRLRSAGVSESSCSPLDRVSQADVTQFSASIQLSSERAVVLSSAEVCFVIAGACGLIFHEKRSRIFVPDSPASGECTNAIGPSVPHEAGARQHGLCSSEPGTTASRCAPRFSCLFLFVVGCHFPLTVSLAWLEASVQTGTATASA